MVAGTAVPAWFSHGGCNDIPFLIPLFRAINILMSKTDTRTSAKWLLGLKRAKASYSADWAAKGR